MAPFDVGKHFFLGEHHLHRPCRLAGQQNRHHFDIVEPPLAERRPGRQRDDADLALRYVEKIGHRVAQLARAGGAGPQRHLVLRPVGNRRVSPHRCLILAVVAGLVLDDNVSFREAFFTVSPFDDGRVSDIAVGADLRGVGGHRLLGFEDMRQHLIIHFNEVQCLLGRAFVDRRHGGHFVADETRRVIHDASAVIEPKTKPLPLGRILVGHDRLNTGKGFRLAGVNALDPGMRMGASEDPAVEHCRDGEIEGKLEMPGDLLMRIL